MRSKAAQPGSKAAAKQPPGKTRAAPRPGAAKPRNGGAPASARTAVRGPSGGGPRRASWTGRAAILALVVAVLIVSYAYPLRTWVEQRSKLSALNGEQAALKEQIETLEQHEQRLRDPAYVRARARERLNFAMPGEIGFIVTEPEQPPTVEPDGPRVAVTAGEGPWWDRLWASVEAADAAMDGIDPGIVEGAARSSNSTGDG